MFTVTDKELLAARGKRPAVERGARVMVSIRTGDGWGCKNKGTVERVASKPDPKGRWFVYVLMDGMPDHNGKERRDGEKNPPLPQFEAGLVRLLNDQDELAPVVVAAPAEEISE